MYRSVSGIIWILTYAYVTVVQSHATQSEAQSFQDNFTTLAK